MSEFKETLDFTGVVSHALIDVYEARAKITWPPFRPDIEAQVSRYLSAVTSLVNLVSPIIGFKPDIGRAEGLLRKRKYRECVKVLEAIVEEVIGRLNELGLLIRTDRGARVGIIEAHKEGVKE